MPFSSLPTIMLSLSSMRIGYLEDFLLLFLDRLLPVLEARLPWVSFDPSPLAASEVMVSGLSPFCCMDWILSLLGPPLIDSPLPRLEPSSEFDRSLLLLFFETLLPSASTRLALDDRSSLADLLEALLREAEDLDWPEADCEPDSATEPLLDLSESSSSLPLPISSS